MSKNVIQNEREKNGTCQGKEKMFSFATSRRKKVNL